MRLMEAKFKIARENHSEAFKAIKSLAGKETIGDHFSWVNTKDFVKASSIKEAMEAWRWSPDFDEAGDIIGITFKGEKLGDDKTFFEAIAPYVEAGSYIQMQGEDGEMWRWVFDGKTVKEINPSVTW